MPVFKNYAEIFAHFKKNPVTSEQFGAAKGFAAGIEHMKQVLAREANILAQCIQESLDEYYMEYTPKQYIRREMYGDPNSLRNGIRVNTVQVKNSAGRKAVSVAINFAEPNAMHPSLFGGQDGFVPNLLNYGWTWRRKSGPYRLAHYEGAHFVERGIDKYYQRSAMKLHIKIQVKYKGRKIVDKDFSPTD